jgi:hypothetical protein
MPRVPIAAAQDRLELIERTAVAAAFLLEIQAKGKTKPKMQTIAIAHGLAYDPHVDGRLRLTPRGREQVGAKAA